MADTAHVHRRYGVLFLFNHIGCCSRIPLRQAEVVRQVAEFKAKVANIMSASPVTEMSGTAARLQKVLLLAQPQQGETATLVACVGRQVLKLRRRFYERGGSLGFTPRFWHGP